MTKNFKFSHKVLSIFVCIALLMTYLPLAASTAKAAGSSNYSSVSDAHTLDGWKQFFGTQTGKDHTLSTEFAGGVWTDKSVFSDIDNLPAEFTAAKDISNNPSTSIGITDTDDNFLISMSAFASNKQIKGYSTIPTDTVLVLDMSSSMRSKDANGGSAVDELADAANDAINRLLELNYNNRIGVVLYSGNTNESFSVADGNVTVLLPLDTYTTSDASGRFLQAYDDNQSMRVLRNSVKNFNNQTMSASHDTAVGTFTQSGIFEAMNQLCGADTTVNSGVQAGTDRIPIMVLMTDGEPTLANNSYYGEFNGNLETTNFNTLEMGRSNLSNFEGTTGNVTQPGVSGRASYTHRDTIAFMSSLTAAFAKKMMGTHYGTNPLLYTLAYGDVVENRPEALAFLNPKESSDIQDTLWNSFLTGRQVTVYNGGLKTQNVASTTDVRHLTAEDRNYVDGYYHADNSEDGSMAEAFQAIVDEIILQSKYYPTLVETDHNHDGYLTFTDKIGKYMQVRSVQGIIVGDRLFSGSALAHGFTPEGSIFGTVENPSDLGDNLVWSLKERLKTDDVAVIRALIDTAFNYKQLSFTSATEFSNYIGWFSDKDGKYIDFYHLDMTQAEIDAAKAKGATHLVRSYLYLGDTKDLKGVSSSDMMYMTVNVVEEIATGDDMVVWKIPASLIPTLTYEIEVMLDENGDPEEVVSLELNDESAPSPIRLLYEVGMREGIYDWNLTEKIPESYKTETENTQYGKKESGYYFYSNKWNADLNSTTYNAYSHFEPSVANERYYYTTDSAVLVKNGNSYTPYTGTTHPKDTGATYYREQIIYKKLTSGALEVESGHEQISEKAIEVAAENEDDGIWYIPKTTMQRLYTQNNTPKAQNTTSTMGYSSNPQALYIESMAHYYSLNTLGNNGRLAITPATGIKLTKTLTAEAAAGDTDFTFTITASGTGSLANAQVIRLDSEGNEASRTALVNNQVTLAAGETVYIVGITAGTYQITENRNDNYYVASINGNPIGDTYTVTVADQTVEAVEFENAPRSFGTLTVSKDVLFPEGYIPTATILNNTFNIDVTLLGDTADLDMVNLPSGVTPTNVTGGRKYTLTLKDNDSVMFTSIPQGVSYTVVEQAVKAGYTHNPAEDIYSHTTHTITETDNAHTVQVVNRYAPSGGNLTGVTVNGTKSVIDAAKWNGETFEIALYRVTDVQAGTLEDEPIAKTTVSKTAPTYSFSLDSYVLSTIGTHYFQIIEIKPATPIADMEYDSTIGRFSVTMADTDYDGVLDVESIDSYSTTTHSGLTVTKNFTNVFTTDVIEIPVEKVVNGATAQQIADLGLKGGLMFGAFESMDDTTPAYSVVTAADGTGTIRIPVTKAMLGTTGKTYYLRELAPRLDNSIIGMKYDTAFKYAVKITWDDTSDKAVAEYATVNGTTVGTFSSTVPEFEFTNEYTDDISVTLSLSGKKTLNDSDDLGGRQFSFSLYETGFDYQVTKAALQTVSNNANAISFADVLIKTEGMHYFVVRENPTTLGGILTDNEYRIAVEVEKVIKNGVTSLQLAADPIIHQLGSTATVEPTELNFNNTYNISGTTEQVIEGIKELTGRPMIASEFRFKLNEINADGTDKVNGIEDEAHNGTATGTTAGFAFKKLVFTPGQIGDHYFEVTEIKGGAADGVTYSEAVFKVKITVTDNGDGTLASSQEITSGELPVDEIWFTNTYNPRSVSIPIIGVKEVLGKDGAEIIPIEAGKFSFSITETTANFVTQPEVGVGTKVITNSGTTGRTLDFGTINFTRAGERYFVIKEILPTDEQGNPITQKNGYTYDTKEYLVTVSAVDNQKGNLEGHISMIWVEEDPDSPNDPIINENDYPVFTNHYEAAASAPLSFSGKKELKGRELKDKEFNFALTETDETFNKVLWDEPLKAQNSADGKFSFESITYTEAGTYYYVISEEATDDNTITFDKRKYYVTVTVTDDMENGVLKTSYTVKTDLTLDKTEDEIIFTNTYTPPAPPTEPPTSPKTSDSRNLQLLYALLFVSGMGIVGGRILRKKHLKAK